jgi:hypothetical protein
MPRQLTARFFHPADGVRSLHPKNRTRSRLFLRFPYFLCFAFFIQRTVSAPLTRKTALAPVFFSASLIFSASLFSSSGRHPLPSLETPRLPSALPPLHPPPMIFNGLKKRGYCDASSSNKKEKAATAS